MEKEIKEISDYLNTTCSNNPAEIQERISVIMVYMMRTGEMLAEAKKILRKKKSDEIQNMIIRIAKENCLFLPAFNSIPINGCSLFGYSKMRSGTPALTPICLNFAASTALR